MSDDLDDEYAFCIPTEHLAHGINVWCREASFRGWRILCACGSLLDVCDSVVEPFDPVAFEDWLDGDGDREVDGLAREDGGVRIHWSELQLSPSAWDRELSAILAPENFTGSVGAVRGAEVTVTSVNDLLNSSFIKPFYLPLDVPDVRWVRAPDALRISQARAAMSNAMRNVLLLADRGYESRLIEFAESVQREDGKTRLGRDAEQIKADASAEWSRRVRAGVAALPKTGPVVCCQSEED